MLPQNEFHSNKPPRKPAPSTIDVDRTKYYDTQGVVDKTFMSRFSIMKAVREGRFPAPEFKKQRHAFYCKKKVDKWVADNPNFTKLPTPKVTTTVSVTFTAPELKMISNAAKALGCSVDFFVADATLWKARGVVRRLEYENN